MKKYLYICIIYFNYLNPKILLFFFYIKIYFFYVFIKILYNFLQNQRKNVYFFFDSFYISN